MCVCESGCSAGMGVVLIKYTGNVWLQVNLVAHRLSPLRYFKEKSLGD